MRKLFVLLFAAITFTGLKAQDQANFGIKWSGFVKNDFFYDSRQTVSAREGHFLLWPSAVDNDATGEDINAKPNFNILAIQSRLKASISGPEAFGARTSGVIEADFFAQANDNINLLRLRHAFLKLNWTNVELLAGQYWNPLFVTDCFPGTVSFNTGTPLQSFARNPQLRLTYTVSGLKFSLAALSQRDYASRGENGPSASYLRNSALPDFHFQAGYGFMHDDRNAGFNIGAGIAYKTIVPRLNSSLGPTRIKVDEKVGGLTAIVYCKIITEPVTIKAQGRYGENIADILAPGGFAVLDIVDIASGEQSYSALRSLSFWGEMHTNGSNVQVGLFGGVFKSTGTGEAMSDPLNPVYGLGTDISLLYRLSPRVIINSGKTRLAFEIEYTSAACGADFDEYHIPASTTIANNIRGLIALYYFF